jgi:hypothetical protein
MKPVNITKEKFEAFKQIRDMGLIKANNFNDMQIVIRNICKVSLTKDECFDIYRKYSEYLKIYNLKSR